MGTAAPMAPEVSLVLLEEAISKVHHIKSDVATALSISPGAPGTASAEADQLEYLQRAQQQIQQLQQLAPQLQQLAASIKQPIRSIQPPSDPSNVWVDTVQQQAGRYSAALQQHVEAALCSAQTPRLLDPRQNQRSAETFDKPNALRRALGEELLMTVFRVTADRGWMQIHLFKSSNNTLIAEMPNGGHHRSEKGQGDHRYPMSSRFIEQAHACDEVRVLCNGVFCASIALAGPGNFKPVRVVFDSADKISSVDPWTASKHQVFKRISYLSVRAVDHFHQLQAAQHLLEPPDALLAAAATPERAAAIRQAKYTGRPDPNSRPPAGLYALECLLWWLACYDDLFSRRCAVSGSLIAWEPATSIPLPPVLRPYWLSLEGLKEAAADRAHSTSSGRKAYHTHLAPAPPAEAAATADMQQAAPPSVRAVAGTSGPLMPQAAALAELGHQRQLLHEDTAGPTLGLADVTDEQLWAQLQEAAA